MSDVVESDDGTAAKLMKIQRNQSSGTPLI